MLKKYSFIIPPLILILFLGIITQTSLFKLKNIDCLYNQSNQCPDYLLAEFNQYRSHNTLTINTQAITSKVLAADPSLIDAQLQLILPDSLIIELTSHPAVVELTNLNQTTFIALGKNGDILKNYSQHSPSLSQIVLSRLQEDLFPYLAELSFFITEANLNIFPLQLESNTLSTIDYEPKITFSPHKSAEEQVTSLQLILSQAKIKDRKIISIDLRFNQPVITYQN
jgi:phage tail protein X